MSKATIFHLAQDACDEAVSGDCIADFTTIELVSMCEPKKNRNSITVHVLANVAKTKADFGYRTGCTLQCYEKEYQFFNIN